MFMCCFFSQAAFRTELSSLLDLMGTGKESLIFMKKRLRRLEAQWLLAARRLEAKIQNTPNEQKQVYKPSILFTPFNQILEFLIISFHFIYLMTYYSHFLSYLVRF